MDDLAPFELHDTTHAAELRLPDVECSWHDDQNDQDDDAAAALQLLQHGSVTTGVVLPAVGSRSPPRDADDADSRNASGARRKRSGVASFLHGLKDTFLHHAAAPSNDATGSAALSTAAIAAVGHGSETPPVLTAVLPPARRTGSAAPSRPASPDRSGAPAPSSSSPTTLAPVTADRSVAPFRFAVADGASAGTGVSLVHPSPPKPDEPGAVAAGRARGRSLVSGFSSPMEPLVHCTDDAPSLSKTSIHAGAESFLRTDPAAAVCVLNVSRASPPRRRATVEGHGQGEEPKQEEDRRQQTDPPVESPLSVTKSSRSLPPIPTRDSRSSLASPRRKPRAAGPRPEEKEEKEEEQEEKPCAVCGQLVAAGSASLPLAAARAVHRACFRCATCREPLTLANFHALEDGFVCTTHYVERLEARQLP